MLMLIKTKTLIHVQHALGRNRADGMTPHQRCTMAREHFASASISFVHIDDFAQEQ